MTEDLQTYGTEDAFEFKSDQVYIIEPKMTVFEFIEALDKTAWSGEQNDS